MQITWPPKYDDNYLPAMDERYWFRDLETMDKREREALILNKLRAQIRYCWDNSPFYRRKWREAGVSPDMLKSLEDLRRFPFTTKDEYRRDQSENPPFGSNLCVPREKIYTIHGTSGTTGKPGVFALSYDDVKRVANAHARIMWSFGLRPSDTVMIAAFFSLYMGSWGALWGVNRLGAKAFPFGAGAPGQTRIGVRWARELKPSALYGTLSYILHFAEVAYEEGIDPQRDFNFRIIFTSGEPGASLPAIKEKISKIFGAKLVDTGSTAEMTPWMTNAECEHTCGMHLWQDIIYAEVVDPKTGEVVDYGEEGVIVYTHLEREAQPMIRFWSNDITTWTDEPCECGRTYPRLPKGIYGRLDDMLIIRGENVFPSAIQEALESVDGYGGEHQIIVTREKSMDVLIVRAEYNEYYARRSEHEVNLLEKLRKKMEESIKTKCGVSAIVELVPPKTFDRTQLKARRVIDQRQLYEELKKLRKT